MVSEKKCLGEKQEEKNVNEGCLENSTVAKKAAGKKRKVSKRLILFLQSFGIFMSFVLLDASLRYLTREIRMYPIYAPAPNLFTLCWAALFVIVLMMIPKKTIGRIVYGVLYYLWAMYTLVQYGHYLIFQRFMFLSDWLYAGEGAAFLSYVKSIMTPKFIIVILAFALIGIAMLVFFPNYRPIARKTRLGAGMAMTGAFIAGILLIPKFYDPVPKIPAWNSWRNTGYEYNVFSSSRFDMQLCGLYQYVMRDAYLNLTNVTENKEEKIELIEQHINETSENEMTGLLKGKNIFLIQMESVDDWMITEESTPTMKRLMEEGINFTNMYTPEYCSGYTFNTEFSVNTGIYPKRNGNAAYSLNKNQYPYSIGALFQDLNYSTNSFHLSAKEYYNRGEMHRAFGYTEYHSMFQYTRSTVQGGEDTFLFRTEENYQNMTSPQPFASFVITYSVHLPYTNEDLLTQQAFSLYPEINRADRSEELNSIYAKTRLTDDMFALMLERLEQDGLLENTVIIAYTDHYNYGYTDKEQLQKLSEEAGSSILQRTPAFIWYPGCEPMEVDKYMQSIDLLPTISNLFGVENGGQYLGRDVFDDSYAGYAIFPDATWLNSKAYVVEGKVKWNRGATEAEIQKMNEFVQGFYTANDAILDLDYYKK